MPPRHPVLPDEGPLARVLRKTGDATSRGANVLAAFCLLLITAINVANVLARYLFTNPFAWAEEVMIFLMIFIVFAGCVTVTWQQIHIRIDILVDTLQPRTRALAATAVSLVGIGTLLMIDKVGFETIARLFRFDQRSLALEVPLWIPQSFLAFGLLIVAILMAVRMVVPRRGSAAPEN